MLEELTDAGAWWRLGASAMVGLGLGGCATAAIGTAPVVTVESAGVDADATLTVAGRLCEARPPVRLELVETRETYPVRLVIRVVPAGAEVPGCVPFLATLRLTTLPPFAESCRERCFIEVRAPAGPGRTVEYPGPKGRR